jgi:DnaJ-class molecular chaperone
MEQRDYYQVLGVEENADAETIKSAFRDLALKYHPDRNQGNPEAAEKMKEVNEAYAVLSNPGKRQEYDAMRKQFGSTAYTHFRNTYSDQDIFRGSDINAILEEMARAFGLRGYEDLFKEFYGQSYRTFEFGRPGFFAKGFVFTGPFGRKRGKQVGEKSVFQKHVGTLSRYFLGKMTGIELPQDGADIQDVIHLSPELAEKGGPYAYFHREKKKKLVVKIPPKIREGQRIRLAGMGYDGKGGASPGNLFLEVRVKTPLWRKVKSFLSSLTR